MKKVIALGIVMLFSLASLNNSFAVYPVDWSSYLTKSQIKAVDKVANTVNKKIDCDENTHNKIQNKIQFLKNKTQSDLKSNILGYLYYSIELYYEENCSDLSLDNLFDDDYSDKKGTFVKNIGANIEARESSKYLYFYYGDKLINTVKNKAKDDAKSIDEFKIKANLYSAEFVGNDGGLILFSKKNDTETKNFVYNTFSGKWIELYYLDRIHTIKGAPNGGTVFLGNQYDGQATASMLYDDRFILFPIGNDDYYDFTFGKGDELRLHYTKYNGTTAYTTIYVNDYIY